METKLLFTIATHITAEILHFWKLQFFFCVWRLWNRLMARPFCVHLQFTCAKTGSLLSCDRRTGISITLFFISRDSGSAIALYNIFFFLLFYKLTRNPYMPLIAVWIMNIHIYMAAVEEEPNHHLPCLIVELFKLMKFEYVSDVRICEQCCSFSIGKRTL